MDRIPLWTDTLNHIEAELISAPVARMADGSGHSGDGYRGGWINGCSLMRIYLWRMNEHSVELDRRADYPHVSRAVEELRKQRGHGKLTQILVSVLEPRGKLSAHRDGLPDDYRYHLPVVTNPAAAWWDENNGTIHMDAGYWHGPVPYCGVLHSAVNNGISSRVHVIADFEKDWQRV